MKKIILFLFIANYIYGQDVPDIGNLLSIAPKWSYITADTNVYPYAEPHLVQTPYWGRSFQELEIDGEDLYVLEYGIGHGDLPLFEGYMLHKIDINSGVPKWVHHNNYFSGNEFQITAFSGNMLLNENIIEVNAFRGFDSLDIDINTFIFNTHTRPTKHIIDITDGQLLDEYVDPDTTRNYFNLHPASLLHQIGNGKQLRAKFYSALVDDYLRDYLHLHLVDENSITNDTAVYVYEHNTNILNGNPVFSYRNVYGQVTHSIGALLVGSIDPLKQQYPTEIKLILLDTSDPENIFITNEIDVLSMLPEGQSWNTNNVIMRVKDEQIMLGQKTVIGEEIQDEDTYIWLMMLDKFGNELSHIERLNMDGIEWDLVGPHQIFEDEMYFITSKNNYFTDGRDLYHFYKQAPQQPPILLASFSDFSNPSISTSIATFDILENSDVLIYMKANFVDNTGKNTDASYIARYDKSVFGLSTNTNEVEQEKSKFSLIPNPANNYFEVISTNIKTPYDLKIFNSSNQLAKEMEDYNSGKIDISSLGTGFYIVNINGKGIFRSLPLIISK